MKFLVIVFSLLCFSSTAIAGDAGEKNNLLFDIKVKISANIIKLTLAPKKGYKLILENDPRLYFDAFAIKVVPAMRGTQKTYKRTGGLVVDIFKPMRYNRPWL